VLARCRRERPRAQPTHSSAFHPLCLLASRSAPAAGGSWETKVYFSNFAHQDTRTAAEFNRNSVCTKLCVLFFLREMFPLTGKLSHTVNIKLLKLLKNKINGKYECFFVKGTNYYTIWRSAVTIKISRLQ
jgi:hypothetical protein